MIIAFVIFLSPGLISDCSIVLLPRAFVNKTNYSDWFTLTIKSIYNSSEFLAFLHIIGEKTIGRTDGFFAAKGEAGTAGKIVQFASHCCAAEESNQEKTSQTQLCKFNS